MAGWRRLWLVALSSFWIGCGGVSDDRQVESVAPRLPMEIDGWSAVGELERHDTESIYAYIDGHAEVYMAYGFRRAISQRYAGPGGDEIVVDLFEVASPADAFGVFSHDRAGDPVAVGNHGVYRHGWLSFWQSVWAGSLYWEGDGEPDREAMLTVARSAAAALPAGGEVPELVSRLPADRVDPSSVCYLRSPQILNAHVFVGSDDPFGLGSDGEAVVGRVDAADGPVHLVLVRYDGEVAAAAVEAGLRNATADRPAMTVGRRSGLLAAVVGEIDETDAAALLEATLGGDA